MKSIVIFISLFILTGVANAQWVSFATSNNSETPNYYINKSLMQRSGDKVKLWELQDYLKPVVIGGKSFLSSKVLTEYDCAKGTATFLSSSYFSQNMGNGQMVGSSDAVSKPQFIEPDSVGEIFYKYACKKK